MHNRLWIWIFFVYCVAVSHAWAQSSVDDTGCPDCGQTATQQTTSTGPKSPSAGIGVTLGRPTAAGGKQVVDVGGTIRSDCDDPLGEIRNLGFSTLNDFRRMHKPVSSFAQQGLSSSTDDWKVQNKYGVYDYASGGEFTAFHTTAKCRAIVFYQYIERIGFIYMGVGAIIFAIFSIVTGKFRTRFFVIYVGSSFVVLGAQAVIRFLS
jgi:hypothetical protein